MTVRVNVKNLRESMGMSIEDLATRLGVHARTIQRWEYGEVEPSPLAIRQLKAIQHPELPRRRDYEPAQSQQTQPSDAEPAPMRGGIIPSRRLT